MDQRSVASPHGGIQHVSDTAVWVAYYRAVESDRPDALFKDPLARVLVGARGEPIARSLGRWSRYTQWAVVIRTAIIDTLIRERVKRGVDTVINLGAGLDTRPYRLDLPGSLRWIEVDFPSTIDLKESVLRSEKSAVILERVALDLADRSMRDDLFARLGSECKNALVLTEGVIPYLTEEQVATLAQDLHAQSSFRCWVAEYFDPKIYPYLRSRARTAQMRNAPFQFFPREWLPFFASHGWVAEEIRYLPEEAVKMNRRMPLPWWARILRHFQTGDVERRQMRRVGFAAFTKAAGQA